MILKLETSASLYNWSWEKRSWPFFNIKNLIILDDIDSFDIDELYSGGVTSTGGRDEGVAGCEGKMVVTPSFKRGNIE